MVYAFPQPAKDNNAQIVSVLASSTRANATKYKKNIAWSPPMESTASSVIGDLFKFWESVTVPSN